MPSITLRLFYIQCQSGKSKLPQRLNNINQECTDYLFLSSGKTSDKYVVRCGEWDTRSTNEPLYHQDRVVEQIILHPAYTGQSIPNNDVAIFILEEPFDLDHHVDTICLPRHNTCLS